MSMLAGKFNTLTALVAAGDGEGVLSHFSHLSNSMQREASRVLEREAARLAPDDFWPFALLLVKGNAKAFLGTLLKAAPESVGDGFAGWIRDEGSEIDVKKTIDALLPRQTSPEGVEQLFASLGIASPRHRATFIVTSLTRPTAFVLFQCMRQMEAERDWLLSLCRHLIKDGTTIGWTLASLARTYFDLTELRGTFSLTLEPYELSRVENSYDAFCRL